MNGISDINVLHRPMINVAVLLCLLISFKNIVNLQGSLYTIKLIQYKNPIDDIPALKHITWDDWENIRKKMETKKIKLKIGILDVVKRLNDNEFWIEFDPTVPFRLGIIKISKLNFLFSVPIKNKAIYVLQLKKALGYYFL